MYSDIDKLVHGIGKTKKIKILMKGEALEAAAEIFWATKMFPGKIEKAGKRAILTIFQARKDYLL